MIYGVFEGEVRVLRTLSKLYSRVVIVAYGDFHENKYLNVLPRNCLIAYRPNAKMKCFLFSMFVSSIYRHVFQRAFNMLMSL